LKKLYVDISAEVRWAWWLLWDEHDEVNMIRWTWWLLSFKENPLQVLAIN